MIPTHIVIHHSASPLEVTFEQIREHHLSRGWSDIGYHFVIDPAGTISKGRAEDVVGAHALGINQVSLGICLIGNFDEHHPAREQFNSLNNLIKDLVLRKNITPENIIGHCDVTCEERGFRKSRCPGENLYCRLEEIRQLAGKASL
jgi:N-acetyl-anhydromuramyl-L-alanine amidase AmpD